MRPRVHVPDGTRRGAGAAALRARSRRVPATTSTAAFVYETLPNDTDLSVFLAAGWTGLNFAFIDGFQRYHTPLDDVAHLDDESLQHLGDGALAGVRALDGIDLAQPHAERGERVVARRARTLGDRLAARLERADRVRRARRCS